LGREKRAIKGICGGLPEQMFTRETYSLADLAQATRAGYDLCAPPKTMNE